VSAKEEKMIVTYDKEADAVYIQLVKHGKVTETVPIAESSVNIDFTTDGKCFGIEIVRASENVELASLKQLKYEDV